MSSTVKCEIKAEIRTAANRSHESELKKNNNKHTRRLLSEFLDIFASWSIAIYRDLGPQNRFRLHRISFLFPGMLFHDG